MDVVQICYGDKITKTNQKKADKIKNLLSNEDTYQLILRPKCENYLIDSDNVIMEMASKNPELLFIDIDITLDKLPEFTDEGLPYFSSHPNGKTQDSAIIYVNNCCDYFKKAIHEKEKRKLDCLWWFRKVVRTKKFNNIDESLYNRSKMYERDLKFLKSIGLR